MSFSDLSMKAKWLDRSLIFSPLCYTVCTTRKSLSIECKNLKIHDFGYSIENKDATTNIFLGQKNQKIAIVCIFNHDKEPEQINALLVHEAMHIWREIREDIGELHPSAEFEAYVIQRICQELFYEYNRQTKKKKKAKKR